jgi:hypothetical protein
MLVGTRLPALPPGLDPTLFPDLASHTDNERDWAGLSVLYPGRVLHPPEVPRVPDPANAGRPPFLSDKSLPHGCTYLRVYDLSAALPKLTEQLEHPRPGLIVDLRYVVADAAAAEKLADLLARYGYASAPVQALGSLPAPARLPDASHLATAPIFVLVNGGTAGPLEAWLSAFQAKGSVLAVGTPTAGQPGTYAPAEGAPAYYVMTGELQPATGSLAGAGLQPRFAVTVTAEQNYRAYMEFERDPDPTLLLRGEPGAPAASGPTSSDNGNLTVTPPSSVSTVGGEAAVDPVLQRAVDVVAALQTLGGMASSYLPAPMPVSNTTAAPSDSLP